LLTPKGFVFSSAAFFFLQIQRKLAKYVGGAVMVLIAKKNQRKYNIKHPREELYAALNDVCFVFPLIVGAWSLEG
jgi:hypothetical protein